MAKRRVLIAGVAGNIAGKLRNAFKDKYDLIVLDSKRIEGENMICADLKEYDDDWIKYFENVSIVILAVNTVF